MALRALSLSFSPTILIAELPAGGLSVQRLILIFYFFVLFLALATNAQHNRHFYFSERTFPFHSDCSPADAFETIAGKNLLLFDCCHLIGKIIVISPQLLTFLLLLPIISVVMEKSTQIHRISLAIF